MKKIIYTTLILAFLAILTGITIKHYQKEFMLNKRDLIG